MAGPDDAVPRVAEALRVGGIGPDLALSRPWANGARVTLRDDGWEERTRAVLAAAGFAVVVEGGRTLFARNEVDEPDLLG